MQLAFWHRCTGILSVASQRSLAASLLDLPAHDAAAVDREAHFLEELLLDARLVEPPAPSRLQ